MRIEGITRKVGRTVKNNGSSHVEGDDVVRFVVRQANYSQAAKESLEYMASEAGIARLLATAKGFGLTFAEGIVCFDEIEVELKEALKKEESLSFFSAKKVVLAGGSEPVALCQYCGNDPEKKGRYYVKGIIEEQEVVIPALYPKKEGALTAKARLRKELPVASYGRFMIPHESQLALLRVLPD